jgi:hypothetical protein
MQVNVHTSNVCGLILSFLLLENLKLEKRNVEFVCLTSAFCAYDCSIYAYLL